MMMSLICAKPFPPPSPLFLAFLGPNLFLRYILYKSRNQVRKERFKKCHPALYGKMKLGVIFSSTLHFMFLSKAITSSLVPSPLNNPIHPSSPPPPNQNKTLPTSTAGEDGPACCVQRCQQSSKLLDGGHPGQCSWRRRRWERLGDFWKPISGYWVQTNDRMGYCKKEECSSAVDCRIGRGSCAWCDQTHLNVCFSFMHKRVQG